MGLGCLGNFSWVSVVLGMLFSGALFWVLAGLMGCVEYLHPALFDFLKLKLDGCGPEDWDMEVEAKWARFERVFTLVVYGVLMWVDMSNTSYVSALTGFPAVVPGFLYVAVALEVGYQSARTVESGMSLVRSPSAAGRLVLPLAMRVGTLGVLFTGSEHQVWAVVVLVGTSHIFAVLLSLLRATEAEGETIEALRVGLSAAKAVVIALQAVSFAMGGDVASLAMLVCIIHVAQAGNNARGKVGFFLRKYHSDGDHED